MNPTYKSFCQGFITSDCPLKGCEAGSVKYALTKEKYTSGDDISLVERYSGGKLGIAVASRDNMINSMCLNLSDQTETFLAEYNSNTTFFNFDVRYKIFNVKLRSDNVSWEIKEDEDVKIGPDDDNLVAVLLTWIDSIGVTRSGWMTYITEQPPTTVKWDGKIGTIVLSGDIPTIITNTNNLWYAYYQNDRTRTKAVKYGDFIAFQAYSRVQSMNLHPLNPYVGGIMQKINSSLSSLNESLVCRTVYTAGESRKVNFLATGANYVIKESPESFGRGNIDFCSSADCGPCSLVYFQIATVNGCIKGTAAIAPTFITSMALVFLIIIIMIIIIGMSSLQRNYVEEI